MNCIFCGSDTDERVKTDNLIVIAHRMCIVDRMEELVTDDVIECLIYEDNIRSYRYAR